MEPADSIKPNTIINIFPPTAIASKRQPPTGSRQPHNGECLRLSRVAYPIAVLDRHLHVLRSCAAGQSPELNSLYAGK